MSEQVLTGGQAIPAASDDRFVSAIGRIQRVPLREVWKHEALDFTCWLQENTDVLNETTGLSLQNVNREQSCGPFNVDLVGDDATQGTVIIENQLEKSDHDHLGKLITYVSALDAKAAVWIVAEPRPEHVQAINWLNGTQSTSFYLLKVEAVRIDASRPAPLLTLITGPSEATAGAREAKQALAERQETRTRFWRGLLEVARNRSKTHSAISPRDTPWLYATAGIPGFSWGYWLKQDRAGVDLWIERGDKVADVAAFRQLEQQKSAIEAAFGATLNWTLREGRRGCEVFYEINGGGYRDEERWPEMYESLVDAMVRLEAAVQPYLRELRG